MTWFVFSPLIKDISYNERERERPNQWKFQDPKMEVPTIYKAYVRPM